MTTREENLKKINEELEKLSDEELEKVAGGARGSWFGMIEPNPNPANTESIFTGNQKATDWLKDTDIW